MIFYSVGPDELNESYDTPSDAQEFEWVVYSYERGYYDGSGEAVGLCNDGLLYRTGLGHCSCYGPMDGAMKNGVGISIDDFLSDKENIHSYDACQEIKDKVRELLGR